MPGAVITAATFAVKSFTDRPKPAAPAPLPSRDDAQTQNAIAKAKDEERKRRNVRRGRASTILTGPRGVQSQLGTTTTPEARSINALLG